MRRHRRKNIKKKRIKEATRLSSGVLNKTGVGKVIQVSGPVVDVQFESFA